MKTMELNRRQFLKTTGALVVSFNLFPPTSDLFGQSSPAASGEPDPTQLDSWIAVSQDGTVTIFTSKVELGTGIETALAQIAAEELDVSLRKIKVDTDLRLAMTGAIRKVLTESPGEFDPRSYLKDARAAMQAKENSSRSHSRPAARDRSHCW